MNVCDSCDNSVKHCLTRLANGCNCTAYKPKTMTAEAEITALREALTAADKVIKQYLEYCTMPSGRPFALVAKGNLYAKYLVAMKKVENLK